ncbi:hypothetical protein I3842_Q024900 [Carya illinoinensis]|uniref:Uncharacterized protein n=1 Tax=Carya illinoinensis TaxID=32201 RepID=A0A922D7R1_CARIL|nr:hypothetical protein I3842_Q024900 [Carya illinoinensis]
MHIFEFFCWICYLLVLPHVVAQIRCLWPRVAADYHCGRKFLFFLMDISGFFR